VVSPDGQLEFRLGVAQPESGALSRLAYQLFYHGKPLIDTSYLGLNIHFQEPLLGENVGLTSSQHSETSRFHSLTAAYMQNGSLARRIDVEVRVANDGVAFRYRVPISSPLMELLLEDETTEFNLAREPVEPGGIDPNAYLTLPFVMRQPGGDWLAITEAGAGGYPKASLVRSEGTVLLTRLESSPRNPGIVFEGTPPLTCPWRVIIVGTSREHLMQAEILRSLN